MNESEECNSVETRRGENRKPEKLVTTDPQGDGEQKDMIGSTNNVKCGISPGQGKTL